MYVTYEIFVYMLAILCAKCFESVFHYRYYIFKIFYLYVLFFKKAKAF